MNDELDDYNDTLNEENGNFDENDLEVTGTQKVRKLATTRAVFLGIVSLKDFEPSRALRSNSNPNDFRVHQDIHKHGAYDH